MIAAALGWVGTMGTFAAYILLWRGKLASDSLTYAVMNTVGGLLGGAASAYYGAWPSVASNVVWAAVGMHSIGVEVRRRIRSRRSRATTAMQALYEPIDCLV
ncbi:hypothetical protein SAMN04489844_1920 [Nocardioides exalbidus]|uniref:CBU-0592-like domain-containing protein n=1 Tax=Nocardioides exalbidus TaxID=402596 RepID=A0A1H4QTZ3_9ACTN|nr:hypothetical protein [Nocardioides exalbidus]SEC23149.1 hypothetical protein SAMN04489844_1920 [Nocardioides exalbidus]